MKAETTQRADETRPEREPTGELLTSGATDGDAVSLPDALETARGPEAPVSDKLVGSSEAETTPVSIVAPPAEVPRRPAPTSLSTKIQRRVRVFTASLPHVDERLARIVLSVVLAALLWFYVGTLENPDRTTVYEDLAVEVRGLGANLRVLSAPEDVNVTIQAPQSVLATLSQADVRPYLELTGLAPGVHTVGVRAELRGGLQFSGATVSFTPDIMQVQIEEVISSQFPVKVRLIGTPAFGYGADPSQVVPEAITVRGVPDAVSRVAEVVVNVDVEDKAGTQQGTRAPLALDQSGTPVEDITFEPQNVEVVVPIKLLVNYKVVPVRVSVPGQPATGYRVAAITYDPTNVTVCCRPEILEPLQFIDSEPVEMNGASATIVTTTNLLLPSDVELFPGQPRTISVTVNIEAIVTTRQLSVSPTIEGEAEGMAVVVSPDRFDLVLSGTFDLLQGLSPTDVRVLLNMQGRGPGTYNLRPQIILPGGVTLDSTSPETLSVTVVAPTATPTVTAVPPTALPSATTAPPTAEPTKQPTEPATATLPASASRSPLPSPSPISPTSVPPTPSVTPTPDSVE